MAVLLKPCRLLNREVSSNPRIGDLGLIHHAGDFIVSRQVREKRDKLIGDGRELRVQRAYYSKRWATAGRSADEHPSFSLLMQRRKCIQHCTKSWLPSKRALLLFTPR